MIYIHWSTQWSKCFFQSRRYDANGEFSVGCTWVFSLMQMYKRIFIILIPFLNNDYSFIMKVSSVILQCHNNGTGDVMMIPDHQRCELRCCLSSTMPCRVLRALLTALSYICVFVCVNDDIMLCCLYTLRTRAPSIINIRSSPVTHDILCEYKIVPFPRFSYLADYKYYS